MERKCAECPADVQAVCRHAFGKFWGDKSHGGEGCGHPLDGVAEAWRRSGWTPDAPQPRQNAPVSVPLKGAVITLAVRANAPQGRPGAIPPKMPRRPMRPTASKTQLTAPTRPKVSAALVRQAELFFGRRAAT